MTKAQEWSDEDIRKLIELRREGRTYANIGEVLGRSMHSIVCKAANIRKMIVEQPQKPHQVIAVARPMSRSEAFTSRFFGDPPPGRSALDQRASQSIPSNKRQQNG